MKIENKYTSLELSKKLKENGCDFDSKFSYAKHRVYEEKNVYKYDKDRKKIEEGIWIFAKNFDEDSFLITYEDDKEDFKEAEIIQKCFSDYNTEDNCVIDYCNSYDILWDICIKYKKEFFGDEEYENEHKIYKAWEIHTRNILFYMQDNRKKAEEYIWKNCLFNPKNKKK